MRKVDLQAFTYVLVLSVDSESIFSTSVLKQLVNIPRNIQILVMYLGIFKKSL